MKYLWTVAIFLLQVWILSAQEIVMEESAIDTNEYAATYLGITTTPYTLPKGAINYQNLYLGYNGIEYGVTDRFSVSAGLSLFNLEGSGGIPFFLFAKYNIYDSPSISVSISNLNIIYPEYDGTGVVSVLYTNAAFGNKNNFITLGAGYGQSFEENEPVLIFTGGYHNRFSKSIAFIVDVWLAVLDLDSRGVGIPLPSLGFRFFLKNQITIDAGFPLFGFKIPLKKVDRKPKPYDLN